MAYQTLVDFNVTGGMDRVFLFIASNMPFFVPLFLFFIWLTVAITIFAGSRIRNQTTDFFGGAAAASIFTFVIATLLTLVPGAINSWTYVIVIVLTSVSVILFYFAKRSYN